MAFVDDRQRLLDGLAIGASGLCLVHCIALPALMLILPALGALFVLPEDFHFWVLMAAIPTSAIALVFGYLHHRWLLPTLLASAGISLLIAAEAAFHGTSTETAVAVFGSLLLGTAHILNLRATRRSALAAGH